ncbi:MAG: bile acid:sodium symporter [Pseudomonadota bacterium]
MDTAALNALQIQLDPLGQAVLAISLMVIMFSIALGLRASDFSIVRTAPAVYFGGVLAQILGLPLLTLGLLHLLSPVPSVALGMIVVACCPGGTTSNLLAYLARGNVAYSVSLTATSSVLAAFMTPVSILFWSNRYSPTAELLQSIDVSPVSFLIQTTVLLGVPLALGMILAARAPDLAARLKKLTAPIGTLVLVGVIIYGAFQFVPILLPAIGLLFGVAIFHNASAFALGFLTALVVRADPPSRRSLTIEVGIQNSGLAIVILIGQLKGLGGAAAIAATWGLWHLIAGASIVLLLRLLDRRGAS